MFMTYFPHSVAKLIFPPKVLRTGTGLNLTLSFSLLLENGGNLYFIGLWQELKNEAQHQKSLYQVAGTQ